MAKRKRQPFMRLKALRVENRLTQETMAKKLGMGESTYILKENGHRPFTLDEAEMIARLFNKTINETFYCA